MTAYLRKVLSSPLPQVSSPDFEFPQKLWSLSMSPWLPLTFSFAYVLVVSSYNHKPRKDHIKGRVARSLVLLHNLGLSLFSLVIFLQTAPPILKYFQLAYGLAGTRGLSHAFCDSSSFLWDAYILRYGFWFYISKYYEVVDTAILLLKGKRVKPLQVYHHAGAILAMYCGIRFQSTPIVFFITFNSFIHFLMYTYYSFSILQWPFPNFLKQSLTGLQILQFILGGSLAFSYTRITLPALDIHGFAREASQCMPSNSVPAFAVWFNIAYLLPLTSLFVKFYVQTYKHKKEKTV